MRIIKPESSSNSIGKQAAFNTAIQGDLFVSTEDLVAANKKGKSNSASKRINRKHSFAVNDAKVTPDALDSKTRELNRLRSKAIRLLAMREHSCQEIKNKLSIGDPVPEYVQQIIEELVENNYLSDHRFTENFVRSKQKRGFGPSRISVELKAKGIENNIIDEYLKANSSVWFECARIQYQKKYGTESVTDYNTWAKRARFLQGRGFGMGHIQAALPTLINQ